MKFYQSIPLLLLASTICQPLFSQNDDKKNFKLTGKNPVSIAVNQDFTAGADISPVGDRVTSIFGLAVSAEVTFHSDKGLVRLILFDENYTEYLVYETYSLLEGSPVVSIDALCEETGLLDGVDPRFIRIEVKDATIRVKEITYAKDPESGIDIPKARKEKKAAQDDFKIRQLNKNLAGKGLLWAAGVTEVSELSYAERKKLYGEGTFPPGFEYYTGGVISSGETLKSASATNMVGQWDWRVRHGKNWISPVKNQASCGSCWAFAATGATEAQVNLFFNQVLNLNLSEQDVLSCSGAGSCSGGYPSIALSYIASTGIVDEAAFVYTATDQPCANKSTNPSQLVKIAGKVDFGSGAYPVSEDNLKKMIIKYGPVSGGLYDWSHAMTLAGWQVVKEGDRFYTRDLNTATYWITVPAGSALIGKTVWIFKNSWGSWGDAGYVYVETAMSNFGWTHGLLSPVQSTKQSYTVSCVDADGDGYYWWGLGTRPASCPNQLAADGDDNNATLGPLDEYGNCTVIGGTPLPPVANFTADKTSVNQSSSVTFTDLSTNFPTSWSWSFPGGSPASSTLQNPAVTYNSPGLYNVSLTVNNATNVPNILEMTNYITVLYVAPVYCSSHGAAAKEWIASVSVGTVTYNSVSTGTAGYGYITNSGFAAKVNSSCALKLVPGFSSKVVSSEYWTVWIDFNQDMDFGDAGEQVLTASRVKGSVSRTITIPSTGLPGFTRMRVSMCRNALPVPCGIFSNGEVKDYLITLSAAGGKSGILAATDEAPPSMKIYPNPANTLLNVEFGEITDLSRLIIFNTNGQILFSQPVRDVITLLDVKFLPAGFYILHLNTGKAIFREKFLKE